MKELNPTWIHEGDDLVGILTVQIDTKDFSIRCVGAYGPQENDPVEREQKFWSRLGSEVKDADNLGLGFILQMD